MLSPKGEKLAHSRPLHKEASQRIYFQCLPEGPPDQLATFLGGPNQYGRPSPTVSWAARFHRKHSPQLIYWPRISRILG